MAVVTRSELRPFVVIFDAIERGKRELAIPREKALAVLEHLNKT